MNQKMQMEGFFMKNIIFLVVCFVLLLIVFGMRYLLNWISDSTLQIILIAMIILVVIAKEKIGINFFE